MWITYNLNSIKLNAYTNYGLDIYIILNNNTFKWLN